MTSLEVTDTDAFLEMPATSQLLYFHLNARADDDGFVSSPKKIIKIIGVNSDDLKVLAGKKFIIIFNDGVCVIKHWRINNFIRKDIYQETNYLEFKKSLYIRSNGAYTLNSDERAIPVPKGHFNLDVVDESLTERQLRIGKVRLGKERLGKDRKGEIHTSENYLTDIPLEDLEEFKKKVSATDSQIKNKADDLLNYCRAKGKRYRDYRAFLLNALKKDFPIKSEEVSKYDKYEKN